jgi:hypothetical protein
MYLNPRFLFVAKMDWATFWGDFVTNSSGADVMITIFIDFRQFSAKNLALFSKTNVMINFLPKVAVI